MADISFICLKDLSTRFIDVSDRKLRLICAKEQNEI